MNILKKELIFNFMSFMLWTLITGLLYFEIIIIYPSIVNSQDTSALLDMFPKELLKAFNMDIANISTASGWLATEGIIFFLIVGGIYSSILGSSIILKEESDKTIEFLYAMPVSKNKIIINKVLCGIIYIFLFTLFTTFLNIIGLLINNDLNFKRMFLIYFTPIMTFLSLYFISILIASFLRKTKKSLTISFVIVFDFYFLQLISSISDKISFVKYFTVFTLSDSRYILENNTINPISILITILIIGICLVATFIKYNKKEYL